MDVVVRNFNCIEDIEVTLNPGFTILQGPSNSGKSSVIKAIENTIFNQSGTSNVRQGQDNYTVGIRKDGHTVSLVKGKNSKYKIDGQVYEKFGVNQLPEVANALNIRETVLGGEKVRLNFSKQMSYPFLLDKTPGQLYKFIVDSSESESLSNVLKDMNKDIKDIEKNIVQYEAKIDVLSKQQTQISTSLSNADIIINISNAIIEMDSENENISQLDMLRDNYNNCSKEVTDLNAYYNKLNLDIDINSLDTLKDEYIQYTSLASNQAEIANHLVILTKHLADIDISFSFEDLDSTLEDINILDELIKKYQSLSNSINVLKNSISNLNNKVLEENEKLGEFQICPLCGSSIKC